MRSELHNELLMTYLKTHQSTKNSSHTVWLNKIIIIIIVNNDTKIQIIIFTKYKY